MGADSRRVGSEPRVLTKKFRNRSVATPQALTRIEPPDGLPFNSTRVASLGIARIDDVVL